MIEHAVSDRFEPKRLRSNEEWPLRSRSRGSCRSTTLGLQNLPGMLLPNLPTVRSANVVGTKRWWMIQWWWQKKVQDWFWFVLTSRARPDSTACLLRHGREGIEIHPGCSFRGRHLNRGSSEGFTPRAPHDGSGSLPMALSRCTASCELHYCWGNTWLGDVGLIRARERTQSTGASCGIKGLTWSIKHRTGGFNIQVQSSCGSRNTRQNEQKLGTTCTPGKCFCHQILCCWPLGKAEGSTM